MAAFGALPQPWAFKNRRSAAASASWRTGSGRRSSSALQAASCSRMPGNSSSNAAARLCRKSASQRPKRRRSAAVKTVTFSIGIFSSLASGFLSDLIDIVWRPPRRRQTHVHRRQSRRSCGRHPEAPTRCRVHNRGGGLAWLRWPTTLDRTHLRRTADRASTRRRRGSRFR